MGGPLRSHPVYAAAKRERCSSMSPQHASGRTPVAGGPHTGRGRKSKGQATQLQSCARPLPLVNSRSTCTAATSPSERTACRAAARKGPQRFALRVGTEGSICPYRRLTKRWNDARAWRYALALADELEDAQTGYLIERALDEARSRQFKPVSE